MLKGKLHILWKQQAAEDEAQPGNKYIVSYSMDKLNTTETQWSQSFAHIYDITK